MDCPDGGVRRLGGGCLFVWFLSYFSRDGRRLVCPPVRRGESAVGEGAPAPRRVAVPAIPAAAVTGGRTPHPGPRLPSATPAAAVPGGGFPPALDSLISPLARARRRRHWQPAPRRGPPPAPGLWRQQRRGGPHPGGRRLGRVAPGAAAATGGGGAPAARTPVCGWRRWVHPRAHDAASCVGRFARHAAPPTGCATRARGLVSHAHVAGRGGRWRARRRRPPVRHALWGGRGRPTVTRALDAGAALLTGGGRGRTVAREQQKKEKKERICGKEQRGRQAY